ncbi:MAG: 6-bladed beta-propeller [Candidatus Aminicenantes bacterium]|nr:6-bladed beta-propeller [Candidatus Aminicenantes bacterium]
MKKTIIICLIVLMSFIGGEASQISKTLKLISSFPEPESEIFFATIPSISIDSSGLIYALDNREHSVTIFDLTGKFINKFGNSGQGPGDLTSPIFIESDDEQIYIADINALSIFNHSGEYLNKFRIYSTIAMNVNNGIIFLAQVGSDNLISSYDQEGNRISSFGTKYEVDYDLYKAWSTSLTDRAINSGKILFSDENIYFVSTLFADVFKYNEDGLLLSKEKLVPENLVSEIEKIFFNIGLKYKEEGKTAYGFFHDITYHQGNFYGMTMRSFVPESPGDILKINEKDKSIVEAYNFPSSENKNNDIFQNICIFIKNNQPIFIVSKKDGESDNIQISVYQIM